MATTTRRERPRRPGRAERWWLVSTWTVLALVAAWTLRSNLRERELDRRLDAITARQDVVLRVAFGQVERERRAALAEQRALRAVWFAEQVIAVAEEATAHEDDETGGER